MNSSAAKKAKLRGALDAFRSECQITKKGALSLVVAITRKVQAQTPPFKEADFITKRQGQVAGLGASAVQSVLRDHGITRILAKEGGRTSRGSMERMQKYLALLNALNEAGWLDLAEIEAYWIERVRIFFSALPIKLKADASKSLRQIVASLIEAAFARQKECPGTMVAGAVMQHLVGAKLSLALPGETIEQHGFSVADAPGGRKGDFLVNDTAIHVTTAPSDALLDRCRHNIDEGIRPVIISTGDGVAGALALSRAADLAERIDVLDIEQFVTTNVYEWTAFAAAKRMSSLSKLIDVYNDIVDSCETDPSLRITLG